MGSPVHKLNYDGAPRTNWRRILRIGCFAAALIFIVGYSLKIAANKFYYHNRDTAKAAVEEVPTAQIMSIDGYDDTGEWTLVAIRFASGKHTDQVIRLRSPKADDLRSGRHIPIDEIGSIRLFVAADDLTVPQHLDIGNEGVLRDAFPFRLKSLRDLTERYNEVKKFFEDNLPIDGTTTINGKPVKYRIERVQ